MNCAACKVEDERSRPNMQQASPEFNLLLICSRMQLWFHFR